VTINKFQGKTKEEAIQKAKTEFGETAVIMNVKEVKPKGIFRIFKSTTYEVTAAMEEKEQNVNQTIAMQNMKKLHDSINFAADEKIEIPKQESKPAEKIDTKSVRMPDFSQLIRQEQKKESEERQIEKRLDDLSNRLEESLGHTSGGVELTKEPSAEELNFIRILYSTLLKNEVSEKYVNQILDEVEQFIRPGNSVDMILANVYQKLILRFGQPKPIDLSGAKPKVLVFVGPTGVGKTTTIAKIASKYKVDYDKKVAFITSDTYRIAATEQLQVYANILDAPMTIVYSKDEINSAIEKYADYDMVFVDTAGFSHKNTPQRDDMKKLLDEIDEKYRKEVYLVLSATTKYKDLLEIVDIYREITDYKFIFTKLDETTTYGNLLNIKLYAGAELSYMTIGQNVPDDIAIFDTQKIVKQLLGGNA
jgi:flagellar biosynthesis protein FlhF